MTTENNLQPSGFSLSSWNYGSFHHCNPSHIPYEGVRREEQREQQQRDEKRSQSSHLNRYNKRVLPEEEKIVTNDQLRLMNDYYIIKFGKPYIRSYSSTKTKHHPLTNMNSNSLNEIKSESNELNDSNHHNISQNSGKSSASLTNKKLKFKLGYNDWVSLKNKQSEIQKKIKVIKDHEDSQLEMYNKRINNEYKHVLNDVFNDWKMTKLQKKQKELNEKKMLEEKKLYEKQEKEKTKSLKMESWFMKQAALMEEEYQKKKLKQHREKEEKEKKQNEENIKKEQSLEAYRLWCKQKEEEKSLIKDNKPEKNSKKRNINPSGKIIIGSYTKSKDLREIHKKLVNDQYFSTDFNQNEENKKNQKIEDSLQELSSIKKDTPRSGVNENDYD